MIEGVDLLCRMEDAEGRPLRREDPGPPPGQGEWAVRRAAAVRRCASAPATGVADLRGGRWEVEGEMAVLAATVVDGRLRSETYPDPLARVWSALSAPHAGDFIVSLELGFEAVDWGGVTHAGGGSHGSLHAGDSLGPFAVRRLRARVGCGEGAVDAAGRRAGDSRALRGWRTSEREGPGVSDKESCGRARASVLGLLVAPLGTLALLVVLVGCLLPVTAVAQEHQVSEAEAIRVANRDSEC